MFNTKKNKVVQLSVVKINGRRVVVNNSSSDISLDIILGISIIISILGIIILG